MAGERHGPAYLGLSNQRNARVKVRGYAALVAAVPLVSVALLLWLAGDPVAAAWP